MTSQEVTPQPHKTKSVLGSVGKVFLDIDGSIWRLAPQNKPKLFGLYRSKELEFVRDDSSLAESVAESVERATGEMVNNWDASAAKPTIIATGKGLSFVVRAWLQPCRKTSA